MTQQLMAYIWLRRVQGPGMMTNILSGMENTEGKSIEEITACQ
jgi:hypothetical protein